MVLTHIKIVIAPRALGRVRSLTSWTISSLSWRYQFKLAGVPSWSPQRSVRHYGVAYRPGIISIHRDLSFPFSVAGGSTALDTANVNDTGPVKEKKPHDTTGVVTRHRCIVGSKNIKIMVVASSKLKLFTCRFSPSVLPDYNGAGNSPFYCFT